MVNIEREHRVIKEKNLGCRVSVPVWVAFWEEAESKGLTVTELITERLGIGEKTRGEGGKIVKQKVNTAESVNSVNDVPDRVNEALTERERNVHKALTERERSVNESVNTKVETFASELRGLKEDNPGDQGSEGKKGFLGLGISNWILIPMALFAWFVWYNKWSLEDTKNFMVDTLDKFFPRREELPGEPGF